MKPDYSFIIVVKNWQALFDRCLKSVLWQDYPSYDIIVVDYGSEPKIVVPDGREIRVIRLDPEDDIWNFSTAFNAGIANARAENLVLVSCDTILAPDILSSAHIIARKSLSTLPGRPWRLQIYWRRFDLTSLGLRWLVGLEPLSAEKCFEEMSPELLTERGLGKWHGLTSYGQFLIVEKAPIVVIGGFDERMTGWGEQDNDIMRRLSRLGYQKYWGKQFKLIHQFHPCQETLNEDYQRNRKIALREEAAGNIVRQGGAQNFEKYRVEPSYQKVHIGCGPRVLKGWINIDLTFAPYQSHMKHMTDKYYPESIRGDLSDFRAMDVTKQSLPFPDNSVDVVFDEDFIEHLSQRDQILFLAETWRILRKGCVHRVNTPNLLVSMEASQFSQGYRGVYVGEWDKHRHRNVLTPNLLEELALTVGYSKVVFTGRDQSTSELVPLEYRPNPKTRGKGGNIFADLIK